MAPKIKTVTVKGPIELPPAGEWGPKFASLVDDRHRRFVWAFVHNGGNRRRAAEAAGFSHTQDRALDVPANRLMQRDDVLEAMQEVTRRLLRGLAPAAVAALGALVANRGHPHHAKAIDMTLSRTGFVERSAVDVNVSVAVDHTKAAVEDLRRLMALAVPRAELERIFGFSGLSRYEAMLAQEDAKLIAGPVIEHEP